MNINKASLKIQHTNEFAIIETDNGLTVAMLERGMTAEEAVARHNGVLIDPGSYRTSDDACDAIVDLIDEDERE